jgi:hypothetical protein
MYLSKRILSSAINHAAKGKSMNIMTDAKNMIHPEVYKQLVAKAAEKGFPIEFALIYFFNRLSMKALGLQYGEGEMFWSHSEDLNFMKKSDLATKTAEPAKTATATKTTSAPQIVAKATDAPWYEGFPKRAINAILTAKIQSMEDLINNYGVEDFSELAGAGESTAIKLAEVLLSEHGLTMARGKLIKKVDAAGGKKSAPAVSAETSAKLSTKVKALEEKITAAPAINHLEEDEVIATDFYKKIADLNIDNAADPSWVEKAISIYAEAWETDLKSATATVRDILKENKVTSKDHATWARGRKALLENIPIQADQIELIEKYAEEKDIEDLEAYILAELDVEDGFKTLTCEQGSELMRRLNESDNAADEKEWF